jgi:uncharacterized protein YbjT (DUF2867 family)
MTTIAVAGATGALGGRIIDSLRAQGADVRAIVRRGTASEKLSKLERAGVSVAQADLGSAPELTTSLAGVTCVVSALQGLRDVIVDGQSTLLAAAVAAGVKRFIPSDFASDFTKIAPGNNRNFDLRREFHERLSKAPIAATSILNGAFAEILSYGTPLLDFKGTRVGYWEDADWHVDFTALGDVASFTAAAALDDSTPPVLRIAGFQISPRELADVASEVTRTPFALVRMGSRDELAAHNARERAAHPEGEAELYPAWQQSQYMHSMFTAQLSPLDNARYPSIRWTSARDIVAKASARR